MKDSLIVIRIGTKLSKVIEPESSMSSNRRLVFSLPCGH
jgi:hypothetical protein